MKKLMAAFHRGAEFLGRGKRWRVGSVTVYLWPFVAMAIFVLMLLGIDAWRG